MKRFALLFAVMFLLSGLFLVNCSEDSAIAPDGNGQNEESFDISYTTDSSRAVESSITAALGGTVYAVDSSGVVFTLEIPANALSQDETIRIIPLDLLTIEGPGVMLCSGCDEGEDCCVKGALFEPEGLEFDSLVTLTVEFPDTRPFPFDSVGVVMVFDSPSSLYSPCPTEVDYDARKLTASISHFSGYGTASPDCEHLTQLYYRFEEAVRATVGTGAIYYPLGELIGLYISNVACDPVFQDQCHVMCPSVNVMIENLFAVELSNHIASLKGSHPVGEATPQSIEEMIEHFEKLYRVKCSCSLTFTVLAGLESDMFAYIRQMAGTVYTQGVTLCQQSECDDGEALLSYVLNLGARGYVTDEAFLQQVEEALDNCCAELSITLSADNYAIPRAVVSIGDLEAGYITLTATVTDPSGGPRVGLRVDMGWDINYSNLGGDETDENGKAEVYVSARDLGSTEVFFCYESLVRETGAKVYDPVASEWYESDPVTLTFKNLVMTSEIQYSFSEDSFTDPDNYKVATAAVSGGGTGPANSTSPCVNDCTGKIQFSYTSNSCSAGECGTENVIGNPEVTGCLVRPVFDGIVLDNGKLVYLVEGINFYSSALYPNVTYERCVAAVCDTAVYPFTAWTRWPVAEIPTYFEGDGTGSFLPWQWSEETETSSTSITITVGVHY